MKLTHDHFIKQAKKQQAELSALALGGISPEQFSDTKGWIQFSRRAGGGRAKIVTRREARSIRKQVCAVMHANGGILPIWEGLNLYGWSTGFGQNRGCLVRTLMFGPPMHSDVRPLP